MSTELLHALPQELRDQTRWINFRTERLPNGKIQKIPCDSSGRNIDPTDVYNFKSFKDVCSAISSNSALGVGYVFHYDESSTVYVGVDFDNCVADRKLFEKVKALVKGLGTYAEYSLSGNGVHIIGKLAAPYRLQRKKFKVDLKNIDAQLEVEVYNEKRFFSCTGKQLQGFENTEVSTVDGYLELLLTDLNKLRKKPSSAAPASVQISDEKLPTKRRSPNLEDDDILGLISASKQTLTFTLLHVNGDLSEYDGDHSRAVLAWHSMLGFYTQKLEQVDRLFRASALYTDKWRDKQDGGAGKWERLKVSQHERIIGSLSTFYGLTPVRDKYVELLIEEFGAPRRDIFTEDLFILHEGRWKNVFSTKMEHHLRSMVQARKDQDYRVTHLMPSLYRYHHYLNPRFLIDIPTWDGRDRVHEMSQCLSFEETTITSKVFEDLAKDWGANAIRRVYNPRIQNHCIILSGEQGIGKDIFWDTFAGGFGEYQANLTLGRYNSEKDMAEVIVQMAIIVISEFDKVRTLGAGVLKDLITKPFFNVRMAYERTAQRYYNRASFLAACNPQQVLTDVTGNRRFWVFKLKGGVREAIKWDYETGNDAALQLLAQFKELAHVEYGATKESLKIMRSLTEQYTPDDVNDLILEQFDEAITKKIAGMGKTAALFRNTDIQLIIKDIAGFLSSTPMQVLAVLKANQRHYRFTGLGPGGGNWYGLKPHTQHSDLRTKLRKDAARQETLQKDNSLRIISTLEDEIN